MDGCLTRREHSQKNAPHCHCLGLWRTLPRAAAGYGLRRRTLPGLLLDESVTHVTAAPHRPPISVEGSSIHVFVAPRVCGPRDGWAHCPPSCVDKLPGFAPYKPDPAQPGDAGPLTRTGPAPPPGMAVIFIYSFFHSHSYFSKFSTETALHLLFQVSTVGL